MNTERHELTRTALELLLVNGDSEDDSKGLGVCVFNLDMSNHPIITSFLYTLASAVPVLLLPFVLNCIFVCVLHSERCHQLTSP